MITERLVFRSKYGQGDALVQLMKGSFDVFNASRVQGARVYTDLTGPMFQVVVEMDFADLQSYAASTTEEQGAYGTPAFQEWFGRMTAVTELGERQLLNMERMR